MILVTRLERSNIFFKDGYKIAFFLVSEAYFISCVELGK